MSDVNGKTKKNVSLFFLMMNDDRETVVHVNACDLFPMCAIADPVNNLRHTLFNCDFCQGSSINNLFY